MSDITFENHDKFHRKDFAERLTTVIKKFSPFYDEAFVLSLNAKFGSGKTTFLNMWKEKLTSEGTQVIYINAWETDFGDEPILPIIGAILSGVSKKTLKKKTKSALQTALGATALASNDLFDKATGINVKGILEAVEKDENSRSIEKMGEQIFSQYSYKKEAFAKLRKELSDFALGLEDKPLVVFVDELDRVRPDYAVKFLESIKHLFSVKGICFVLAVDRDQLENSIRQLYGNVDFENYYRRFVTREANLPEAYNVDIAPYINMLASGFLDKKKTNGLHYPFDRNTQGTLLAYISGLCKLFEMKPREIESFFRIFSQFMVVSKESNRELIAVLGWLQAASMLIAIFIKNRKLYHDIGKGLAQPPDMFTYLHSLNYSKNNGE